MDKNVWGRGPFYCRIKNIFQISFALAALGYNAAVLGTAPQASNDEVSALSAFVLPKCTIGEVASCASRTRYFSLKFAQFLLKQKPALEALKPAAPADPYSREAMWEARKPSPLVIKMCSLLSAMIVIPADHIISFAPRVANTFSLNTFSKLPTLSVICQELTCLALEQLLPLALELECLDAFIKFSSQRTASLLFDIVKEHLKNYGKHIAELPDDDSPRIEFSVKYGEPIVGTVHSILAAYGKLYYRGKDDCALHLSPKFAVIATQQKSGLTSSLLPICTINAFLDTLATSVVTESNAISEKLPNKSIFDIISEVTRIYLQHTLSAVSCSGLLWGFGNSVRVSTEKNSGKDESKSPLVRRLKNSILDAPAIIKQATGSELIDDESDENPTESKENSTESKENPDESKENSAESKEKSAEEQKKLAKKQKKLAEKKKERIKKQKKLIRNLINSTITTIREQTKGYYDVFQKRGTFGNVPPPL
jgi:hypothetical protein